MQVARQLSNLQLRLEDTVPRLIQDYESRRQSYIQAQSELRVSMAKLVGIEESATQGRDFDAIKFEVYDAEALVERRGKALERLVSTYMNNLVFFSADINTVNSQYGINAQVVALPETDQFVLTRLESDKRGKYEWSSTPSGSELIGYGIVGIVDMQRSVEKPLLFGNKVETRLGTPISVDQITG